jgi:hypothetical protein
LALAAEVQEVSLTIQLPDDLAPAQADPDRVAQVLRNLVHLGVNKYLVTQPEPCLCTSIGMVSPSCDCSSQ